MALDRKDGWRRSIVERRGGEVAEEAGGGKPEAQAGDGRWCKWLEWALGGI